MSFVLKVIFHIFINSMLGIHEEGSYIIQFLTLCLAGGVVELITRFIKHLQYNTLPA
jgi:hypothetical protein